MFTFQQASRIPWRILRGQLSWLLSAIASAVVTREFVGEDFTMQARSLSDSGPDVPEHVARFDRASSYELAGGTELKICFLVAMALWVSVEATDAFLPLRPCRAMYTTMMNRSQSSKVRRYVRSKGAGII